MSKGENPVAVPEADQRDLAYAAARTGVGLVPVFGGALQEVLDAAVGAPLEKRRLAWFKSMAAALNDFSMRFEGFDPRDLAENEHFIDTVVATTAAAMRTHSEEKRRVLRNVVLNSAVGVEIDDVLRGTFLSYAETFSPAHIKMLQLLHDPRSREDIVAAAQGGANSSLRAVMLRAMPEFESHPDLLGRVFQDLSAATLVQGDFDRITNAGSLLDRKTTLAGEAFVQFVNEPTPPPWPR